MNHPTPTTTMPHHDLARFDAAIVDLDGTMVDTMGDFAVALNLMLSNQGLPAIERAMVEKMVGKGSEHLVQSVLRHVLPADVATDSEAFKAHFASGLACYQQHYLAINGQHSAVYAGVIDGLKGLQAAGLRLACLTNKPLNFARPLLAAKGLDGFFAHAFGGDSFERKKPDPLPLLKTCEALASLPARTLMIGDSSNDALAARAAGCPVVLLTYGYNHGEPLDAVDCDARLDALTDLLN